MYTLGIGKKLTKLSTEKGCEVVGRWKKACIRHFYWCVTSTPSNQDEVKYAKFESFFSHILNKHINLSDKIFNKCAHGIITQSRVWLTKIKCTITLNSLENIVGFIDKYLIKYNNKLLIS